MAESVRAGQWEVQLIGDRARLERLAPRFTSRELTIAENGGEFVLQSSRFEALTDSAEVSDAADRMATLLSGAAQVWLGSGRPISSGMVYRIRDDGRRDKFVQLSAVLYSVKPNALLGYTFEGEDGRRPADQPGDLVRGTMNLSLWHEPVRRALRLRNVADIDWAGLYRVLEVIEEDLGKTVSATGWTTEDERERFRYSANSRAASGDAARHGRDGRPSHRLTPMSIRDGQEFVDEVLRRWIRKKLEELPGDE